MKDHYDIGVVGCWYWGNYGSILNGYATYKILKSFNLSVLNIITPNNGFEPHAKRFFSAVYPPESISDPLTFNDLKKLNHICDMFLTGSDQIWRYNSAQGFLYDSFFHLSFVDDNKPKISFATSFGNNNIPPKNVRNEFEKYLKRYKAISVREPSGVKICKDYYNITATQVLEPVFDIPKDEWNRIANMSSISVPSPYILTYILDPNPNKVNAIKYYASKLGLKVYNILDGFSARFNSNKDKMTVGECIPNIWGADFLNLFSNAEFVITDSFHGMAFSLIFNKTFIAITNTNRGNDRFISVLGKVNLLDRLVDENNIPLNEKLLEHIDYSNINFVLQKERERAIEWLRTAIFDNSPTQIALPLNISRLDKKLCTGCGACNAICPTNAISILEDINGYYKASLNKQKCVNCQKCFNVCPALGKLSTLNAKTPEAYSFVHDNKSILNMSASGGAFYWMAKNVLDNNGVVVGAAYDGIFDVKHIIINDAMDLQKLQKSKYYQGYTPKELYKSVEELLKCEVLVLYSGRPCQIAGLQNYLGRSYENLITIDLFCATCPSKLFFKKYLDDKFGLNNVMQIEFRTKSENDTIWDGYGCTIITKDGKRNVFRMDKYDDYYKNFLLMAPEHCRHCKYQGTTRIGDITIGDCWGIQNYDINIDYTQGVSAILINNEKGKKFINGLPKTNTMIFRSQDLDEIKKYNVCAFQENRNWPKNKQNEKFYELINQKSFSTAIQEALKTPKE